MKFRKLPCLFIYVLFCLSCAKQGIPSGGPKDSIPPKLISSIPKQRDLNFKQKELQLTFSESVFVNNPKEQIIITPSVGKDFDATAKNKVVTLVFEQDLKDSTTYTLSFRDAIKDITEKNSAQNLKLAFSTGPYIDSLSIDGKVSDLLKEKDVKDITVALYQNADTFNIFKHKPLYLTKTDDKGFFKIENLKRGIYYLYAYEDKNKNLIVDSKNESYGFITDSLDLRGNIKKISIQLVRLDARPIKLTSAKPYSNYFNIRTSKNLVHYSIEKTKPDSSNLISCFGDDQANVRIYNTLQSVDSVQVRFLGYDSIEHHIDSTLYVKFSKKEAKPEKFSMKVDASTVQANTGLFRSKISFNKPISKIDLDSIFFQPDSTTIINFTEGDFTWDFTRNSLSIAKKFDKKFFIKEPPQQKAPKESSATKPSKPTNTKPAVKNNFVLGIAAFISIDNDSSTSSPQTPKILREEDTGILKVSIKTSQKNYICQLLTNDYKVIDYVLNKSNIVFQNLPPAGYLIRLIIDKNGNGKWDPGNFYKRIEPEPALFFKNEKNKDPLINLKANWEVGPLLITYP